MNTVMGIKEENKLTEFTYPVGYHKMHNTKIIDFQLNRWYSFGYTTLEEMQEAGRRIGGLPDWKGVMVDLADKAMQEGRLMSATFLYRAAEFHTHPNDPDKLALYDKFIDLFYNRLFVDEPIERFEVPYEDAVLTGFVIPAQADSSRGDVVIHGGFDSFIEELYSVGAYFAHLGYRVFMFDGPGQGAPLKHHGLTIDHRWEKVAKVVLDYFDLGDVTWIGFSMGGWFCFRAAAFEPRIQRVIASSIAYDYMEIPPKFIADFARWLMKRPKLMNWMSDIKMRMMPQEKWGIDNLMYISDTDTPLDASFAILEFNKDNLMSEKVTQDVLILTGEQDHFIPMKLHHMQVDALENARSVTERIFTEKEQAHNHCQIGNIGLALETMAGWIEEKTGS
jgi:pimeloyl-ACP methyl ester carboxylesterase